MRTSTKTLHFPLAGLDRSRSYGVATEPSENRVYATPLAMNVRGTDVFGGRFRGGSRPGLKSVDIPDSTEVYTSPTTIYRGRKIYADGHLWFASRAGDMTDFNMGGDGGDFTRPTLGKIGYASEKDEEPITAIFNTTNDTLFIATRKSVWTCSGDVASGSFVRVAEFVGVVSKDAWAYDGRLLYVVSSNGIYAYAAGQGFVRISENAPEELISISSALCAYDPEQHALHIFTDKGDWLFDIDAKSWWPQEYNEVMRPIARKTAVIENVRKTTLLGSDKKWRVFDDKMPNDDGESFNSIVAIGPIRTGAREDMDGMIDKLSATFAANSSSISCSFCVGKTAEESIIAAKAGDNVCTIPLKGGLNHNFRPRVRGAWVTLVLSATEPWAFESMAAVVKSLGGLR